MRLASYKVNGERSFGIVAGESLIDVGRRIESPYPSLKFALQDLDRLHSSATTWSADLPLASVEMLPPIPDPGRIICIGRNYKTAIEALGLELPNYPILFTRFADSQVGHGEPLIRPMASDKYDFEGELAFVIGRPGRHIDVGNALEHVAGYSCYNDGSLRDFQRHTGQDTPGKNFWRSGSFGPWITTTDEIPDPSKLAVTTRLNGELMQSGEVSDLLFSVSEIVAYLSVILPLEPGDVIATGTPAGVGMLRDPPVWLRPGDCVEVTINEIGTLANTVIDEQKGDN